MNNLHSSGLKELVLGLKDDEYFIGVERKMAPIYTLGNFYNGYEKATPSVIIKKNIFELLNIEKGDCTAAIELYDIVRINDYVFFGNLKIAQICTDGYFKIVADGMVVARYTYEFATNNM